MRRPTAALASLLVLAALGGAGCTSTWHDPAGDLDRLAIGIDAPDPIAEREIVATFAARGVDERALLVVELDAGDRVAVLGPGELDGLHIQEGVRTLPRFLLPKGPVTLPALRLAAARSGVSRLLVTAVRTEHRRELNAFGIAYITLVGGLFVPSETHEVRSVVEAALLDARDGAILWSGTLQAEADEMAWPSEDDDALHDALRERTRRAVYDDLGHAVPGPGEAAARRVSSAAPTEPGPPGGARPGWASRMLIERVEDAAVADLSRALEEERGWKR